MNEEKKKTYKVRLLTIQTPHGEVPTAKSLKKLAEYWNSVIQEMNKGRTELHKQIVDTQEKVEKIFQKVRSQGQKIKLLVDNLRDVQVSINTLREEIKDIKGQIGHMEEIREFNASESNLEATAKEILLEKNEKEKGE